MRTRILQWRSTVAAPAREVFAWHGRPGAFERLNPPWDPARVVSRTGGIEDEGSRVVLKIGPLGTTWVAEHSGCVPEREFRDRQLTGPFAHWEHIHRMEPKGDELCVLEDRIEYALPGGAAGRLLGQRALDAALDRVFAYRHRVTANDLAAHEACRGGRAMKVAVSGASGLIGTALVPFLTAGGHEVLRLVRGTPKGEGEVRWDPARGEIDSAALAGLDAVVHLSGESIAGGRWSDARKKRLRKSRVETTALLARTLATLDKPPRVLVSASAVGIYGSQEDRWLTESSPAVDDFLGRLSVDWEAAAVPAAEAGIRVVHPRFGLVLSPAGGVLGKMLLPFKLGLGGVIGPGTQYMSWVALDDVLGALHHVLLDDSFVGAFNLVAPEPVTNREFTKALGRVLGRPTLIPAPAFALRVVLGEMADGTLLSSARVRPERLEQSGYAFRFSTLEGALRHVLGRAGG